MSKVNELKKDIKDLSNALDALHAVYIKIIHKYEIKLVDGSDAEGSVLRDLKWRLAEEVLKKDKS
jgi:hypothetical protein